MDGLTVSDYTITCSILDLKFAYVSSLKSEKSFLVEYIQKTTHYLNCSYCIVTHTELRVDCFSLPELPLCSSDYTHAPLCRSHLLGLKELSPKNAIKTGNVWIILRICRSALKVHCSWPKDYEFTSWTPRNTTLCLWTNLFSKKIIFRW